MPILPLLARSPLLYFYGRKPMKQLPVLIFLALSACKQKTPPQKISPPTESEPSPELQLTGSFASMIDPGEADFVVIRDCTSGGTCSDDVVSPEDVDMGDDILSDIDLGNRDAGSVQTLSCRDKSRIWGEDGTPMKEVTLDQVVYGCILKKFEKTQLLGAGGSEGEIAQELGHGAGLGMAKRSAEDGGLGLADDGEEAGASGEGRTAIKEIVITDFDGTQGLGDYDPGEFKGNGGFGEDLGILDDGEWEDFCRRKLGGDQGLKEFRAKVDAMDFESRSSLEPVDVIKSKLKKLSAAEIVELFTGTERNFQLEKKSGLSQSDITNLRSNKINFGIPRSLDGLHGMKGSSVETLAAAGHMVKYHGKYYNTPTWLDGSVESLHGHLTAPDRLVMLNSTNFRPNVEALIAESLHQEFQRNPDTKGKGLPKKAGEVGSRLFVGTAETLGVTYPSSKLNAFKAGTRVRLKGDKYAIGRKTMEKVAKEYDTTDARVVSLDDKPGKGKEFASLARDYGWKHVYIQSDAVKKSVAKPGDFTSHIQASNNVFSKNKESIFPEAGKSVSITQPGVKGDIASRSNTPIELGTEQRTPIGPSSIFKNKPAGTPTSQNKTTLLDRLRSRFIPH
jgi:hypothetical protein